MELLMPPQWKDARYESLSPEVQKLYDGYVEAYDRSRELAQRLQVTATSEWLAKHPNGIDGKFVSYNVNGGRLRWVMATKRPLGNYKTVGEDIPSVGPIKQKAEATTTEISVEGNVPGSVLAIASNAQKNWGELGMEDRVALKSIVGTDENTWSKLSTEERKVQLRRVKFRELKKSRGKNG
jgi:hypothetical protein